MACVLEFVGKFYFVMILLNAYNSCKLYGIVDALIYLFFIKHYLRSSQDRSYERGSAESCSSGLVNLFLLVFW